jgi:integrase
VVGQRYYFIPLLKKEKTMSKITFRHRAKDLKSQTETPLKIRLIVSRQCSLEMNSGLNVKPINWNKEKGIQIKRYDYIKTSTTKKLTIEYEDFETKLSNLTALVVNKEREAEKEGLTINSQWLKAVLDEFNGKTPKAVAIEGLSNYLIDHIKKYIELAPTKKVKNKEALGLATNTIIKYKTFQSMMENYEKHLNKRITFKELGKQFYNEFIHWLLETKDYCKNYSGKQIDHMKTISKDAEEYGIEVNNYYTKLESFKEENNNRYIVTYSFEEIEIIRKKEMPTECLENAKKWMILGFEIGQRGSDLLAIDKTKITSIEEDGSIYMDVYQSKTDKWVNVPFLNELAINIVNNDFPYSISLQKFNEYIKDVVKICGFHEPTEGKKFNKDARRKDEPTEGKKLNKETGRNELGIYPKHELTTSHTLRRSFATNWYLKMQISEIMEITGHTKESQFREYINVREDKEKGARNFAEKAKTIYELMKSQQKKSA